MIIIKSQEEITLMQEAGKVTAALLQELPKMIRPGVSTKELDDFAEKFIRDHGQIPAFKGYSGYPASVCTSVNQQVVHGIPSPQVILKEGDIISIDVGTIHRHYHSDAARTFAVGEISPEAQRLIDTAKNSFFEGLKYCRPGYRLSDVSAAIQKVVEDAGFSVVRDFVGHGIGRKMHEEPQIPNYGKAGRGPKLMPGMVLAIEPMINEGGWQVDILDDEWTVETRDGTLSAHYENTVVITEGDPILTTI